ncbi:tRNA (adenosine(37)-N6)-threonylcarbamoyltransferase complex ATPase subunit type 1 TsaE [Aquimarina intermedia]|uniref:tRNA threonylcarbamoyladenosine biosynthesis protein TsaE n=1 Tax=Aquimarina intermedia TaxID=350814 RepID=A0A5S5C6J6_9FLAO|nr:tRNA (adenosine(37)-N6)-threonylcarbamoyltransferase complex ATPase subunit type 1 TsaE [Aquimarina intermedia]TYP75035.1 tRNA threonylcarbamoyladenosine biosynthesis protein TsaE [Aquimarina intermedia]
MTFEYTLDTIDEVAHQILNNASSKIFLFDAPMGAGKTTLIKELCKQLGVKDTISSPTYSLVNEYQGTQGKIYHFDLYRLENTNEILDSGLDDYLYEDAFVFIEWPEKMQEFLPNNYHNLRVEIQKNGLRVLKIS